MNQSLVEVNITVNGRAYCDRIPADLRLIDYLRSVRQLMGSKKACGAGECGACTVLLEGKPVYSCILLALQADGKQVETIESLGDGEVLHPIQEAFLDAGAVQCGFCTPGMILSSKALLDENPDPNEEQIKIALSGNLCRCTGYRQIIDAVQLAAARMAEGGEQR